MATVTEEPKKKVFLDGSNSFMPNAAAASIGVGGVKAKGPVAEPYKMPGSVNEAIFGAGTKRSADIIPSASAAEMKPAASATTVASDMVAQPNSPAPATPVAAGARRRYATDMPAGTGVVIDNATGKEISVGGQSTGTSMAPQVAANSEAMDGYGAQAKALVGESQRLLNSEVGSSVTTEGQSLTAGENSVGRALVARGIANRAKTLSDMGNQEQATRNSVLNTESQVADRFRTADREDAESAVTVQAKESELALNARLATLQDEYLKETDPAKKEAAAAAIAAITGKAQVDKFQPIMGKDDVGNPVYLGAFNSRTGEATNQPGQAAATQTPTPPPGMKYVGTSQGRPVFEDANGKRFIQ